MKIGLYFGSFNPPHRGHIQIAQQCIKTAGLDEVWFVVSPQNPFKEARELASENDRYAMVKIATVSQKRLRASDVEFSLTRPSFTCDTLRVLMKEFSHEFHLIIGGDNWRQFHLWKDYQWILNTLPILVYRRPGSADNDTIQADDCRNIKFIEGELIQISATEIRKRLSTHETLDGMVDDSVIQYIEQNHLYGQ